MQIIKVSNKIKGSTITEVIVASIITTLSIAMGLMIFLQVMRSNQFSKKMEAEITLSNFAIDQKSTNNLQSTVYKINNIKIVQVVKEHPKYKSCKILQLTAYDPFEKVLGMHKEILYLN